MYPNPANSRVTFQFENAIDGTIELYQSSGRLIHSQKVASTNTLTLDISNLSSGVYYYKVVKETQETEIGKLNIQH